ncbi:hypothetical protein Dda3937_04427 [Dickeya dadantii 3937]|uniref:Uncharacterized protein n=1 Tax=Dickeya dadantii (strain 3937) TaxID=198628 RepID=E0SDS9_DICD3|nr:hypothetical protein Dda3937_04427 [Dickeya dadantii 3937]
MLNDRIKLPLQYRVKQRKTSKLYGSSMRIQSISSKKVNDYLNLFPKPYFHQLSPKSILETWRLWCRQYVIFLT